PLRVFLSLLLPPLISSLFPYTTLFRSICLFHKRFVLRRSPGAGPSTKLAQDYFNAVRENCLRAPRRKCPCPLFGRRLGSNQRGRSEEHTFELQSRGHLVCRLLLEKKN